MENMKKFNVLEYKFNRLKSYDVLPFFRRCWTDEKEKVSDRQSLKEWIVRKSSWHFHCRCEYEFLIASWPFSSYRRNEALMGKTISKENIFEITNIFTREMEKIDVHYQIMMNIDTVVDILAEEFGIA